MDNFEIFRESITPIILPKLRAPISMSKAYDILIPYFSELNLSGRAVRKVGYYDRNTRLAPNHISDWLHRYVNPTTELVKPSQASYFFRMTKAEDFIPSLDVTTTIKSATTKKHRHIFTKSETAQLVDQAKKLPTNDQYKAIVNYAVKVLKAPWIAFESVLVDNYRQLDIYIDIFPERSNDIEKLIIADLKAGPYKRISTNLVLITNNNTCINIKNRSKAIEDILLNTPDADHNLIRNIVDYVKHSNFSSPAMERRIIDLWATPPAIDRYSSARISSYLLDYVKWKNDRLEDIEPLLTTTQLMSYLVGLPAVVPSLERQLLSNIVLDKDYTTFTQLVNAYIEKHKGGIWKEYVNSTIDPNVLASQLYYYNTPNKNMRELMYQKLLNLPKIDNIIFEVLILHDIEHDTPDPVLLNKIPNSMKQNYIDVNMSNGRAVSKDLYDDVIADVQSDLIAGTDTTDWKFLHKVELVVKGCITYTKNILRVRYKELEALLTELDKVGVTTANNKWIDRYKNEVFPHLKTHGVSDVLPTKEISDIDLDAVVSAF